MATSLPTIEEPTTRKRAGRPRRDLHKATIAIDATSFALAEKSVIVFKTNRTAVLEDALKEYAQKRNITVTPEEVDQLLQRPPGTTAKVAALASQGVEFS